MTNTGFLRARCLRLHGLLFACGILFAAQVRAADAKKLNVLLIIADDQNCELGCYGNKTIHTPNLDRLASLGVRFDRSYCNYPVCNASRTSFLSGRYPDTTRVFGNGTQPRTALGKNFQFLPEYFRAQGWFTAGIGKIAHGSFPESIKWDVFAEPMRGVDEDDKTAAPGKRARRGKKGAHDADAEPLPFGWQATDNKDEEEPDGVTARKVAKLLETHREGPFFIAAGFHKPHVPHTAPKKYFEMYPPEKMPLPIEPTDHAKGIPEIANPPKYFPDLKEAQERSIISHYLAASTFMDAQVGVLLETMDRLKLWDSTVVVFMGDHGWHLGEHDGFWAKMSVMEESARAPLIVVAPGRKANVPSTRLVEFVDLFPSLCELCGVPQPDGLEGTSFVPLLDDPQRAWKKAAFTVVSRGRGRDGTTLGRSVRTGQFTYNDWPDGSTQLFDHDSDSKEYFNLAMDKRHAATVAEMKQLLKDGWKSARPPAN